MDTDRARELFRQYAAAVVYVEVESTNGDRSLGSAFHVGEGVFVTARHVVDGKRIVAVGATETAYVPLVGAEAKHARTFRGSTEQPVHIVHNKQLDIDLGPFFHEDPLVDVAVFRVADIDSRTPVLPLGDHLDDWLGESDFVLSEAIVLGYPPIPLASRAHLVGARAEVNAMIDRYDAPHVHFILSATPRGGFSGGVAISEWGQVIGLITQSLLSERQVFELGYMTVITVEPIYVCLADYKLLPRTQAEGWNGLWNSTELSFLAPGTDVSRVLGGLVVARSILIVSQDVM